MSLIRVTDPVSDPLDFQEVKDYLRVKNDAEDGVILTLIQAATSVAEKRLGRSLMPQTWKVQLTTWYNHYSGIELPKPPITDVTGITYVDADGAEQTLTEGTDYFVSDTGQVHATDAFDFPDLHEDTAEPISITYTAGYATAAKIPADIKHWMKMLIGTAYLYREEITPMSTHSLESYMNKIEGNNRIVRFS